ncbi:hypothetical protein [Planosporangium mesophilum]|uniref:DUF4232 domain-containing protein n=1 Tax=Planosporangium mesophilum TaxID=689768 RepID=A0A8J3TGS5_9ACTN|nr:hypothetical protein [Planosporangium mesophilum]NJC83642.1 hypothetical protein [Planosporangium mesophilum]GII25306.1 hypothetical protein Pme01_49030 [Planosporangium mesophilum]
MKLTVGPLPPAVYWRRRAAVAGALVVVVATLVYSCTGNANDSRTAGGKPAGKPSPGSSGSPSPSPSRQVFTPASGLPQVGEGGDLPPAAPNSSDPPAAPSSPCTDEEMSVTAVAESASVGQGSFVKFTLRIKNVSNRSCTRDVGADAQELYLQDAGKVKVWSSDSCDPPHGTDVRTFGPGIETQFWQVWDGKATNAGCTDRKAPPVGKYELFGRLATKLGDPVAVELK